MKIINCVCFVVIFFMVQCLSSTLAHAQGAPTYLGEICFTMEENCPLCFKPPVIITERLGILSYGTDHILLNGTDGSYGTAIFDGSNIIVNLNSSYVSGDFVVSLFSTVHMVVNPTTLSGTYKTMTVQTDPPPANISSSTGSINFFACQ